MSVLLVAALGIVGFLAAVSLHKAFVAVRELHRAGGRLRLIEVARARRLVPRPAWSDAAVRRCMACRSKARCDKLAALRDWEALRTICPNTAYLASLVKP